MERLLNYRNVFYPEPPSDPLSPGAASWDSEGSFAHDDLQLPPVTLGQRASVGPHLHSAVQDSGTGGRPPRRGTTALTVNPGGTSPVSFQEASWVCLGRRPVHSVWTDCP